MGAGLYFLYTFKGISYSDPNFVPHFQPVLAGLAAFSVICALLMRRELGTVGYPERRWDTYLWVMIPVLVLLVAALIAVPLSSSVIVIFTATLWVGISEELTFRYIFLGALLQRSAAKNGTVISAVLVSSLAFAALHVVNILGGQSVVSTIGQRVATFLAGILTAFYTCIQEVLPQ